MYRTQNTGEFRSTRPKSVCLVHRRPRQEDHETEASLGYLVQTHKLGSSKGSVCRFTS